MKKVALIFIVLLFGVASSASAQVPSKPFSLYLNAGLNSVSSPDTFKDLHKLGYHVEGGIGFKAFPFIEIVGKVGLNTIAKDWNLTPILSDALDGGNVKIMTFGLDARAALGAPLVPIKPFAFIGGGYAKISEDDITVNIGDIGDYNLGGLLPDQTKFYYNIGAGLEFGGAPFSFFIQARYTSIATDGESIKYIPVSLGIKF